MTSIALENFSAFAHILLLKQSAPPQALTVVGFRPHRERKHEYLIDDHSGIAVSRQFAHVAVQLGLGLLSGRRTGSDFGGGFGSVVVSRVDCLIVTASIPIKKGRQRNTA